MSAGLNEIILEEPAVLSQPPVEFKGQAQIVIYQPNKVVIKAEAPSGGWLVLCDNYYPGWKAFIDKRSAHIFRADYILRAVLLPPGSHIVEFVYFPDSLKIGGILTCLFLLSGVILAVKYTVELKRK